MEIPTAICALAGVGARETKPTNKARNNVLSEINLRTIGSSPKGPLCPGSTPERGINEPTFSGYRQCCGFSGLGYRNPSLRLRFRCVLRFAGNGAVCVIV